MRRYRGDCKAQLQLFININFTFMTHIKKSTISTKYKTDQLVKDLKSLPEVKLPPILVYIACLNLISIKLNTDINKCRTSYGYYTAKQWIDLLEN